MLGANVFPKENYTMSVILVTGANRGIGLEIARQLQQRGDSVIAVCRQASAELKALNLQCIEGIDVGSDKALEALRTALTGVQLDGLINNAGRLENTPLETSGLDYAACRRQFEVNTLGPLRVFEACRTALKNGSKVLMVTSRMGSIADNTSGGAYGYRMSKAALNMASVSLAQDLKAEGIAVGLVHPGYVRTEMTGFSGQIEPAESARGIIARLDLLNHETSGGFWHVNGESLPW